VDGESRSRRELSEYVCGGYFIAKVTRYYRKSDLVPDPIVTVSPCMAKRLPGAWAFEQVTMTLQQRKEEALNHGIGLSDVDRLVAWTADRANRNEIAYPDLLSSKKIADELVEELTFDRSNWNLLAIGLRQDQVKEFLSEFEQARQTTPGMFGIPDVIRRRETPDPTGRLIGFDVLAIDYGECHSWFCNSLEEPIAAELGIRPGAYGLLPTWSEANACAE
jgi:hypothetical protein